MKGLEMELHLIPHEQLINILVSVKQEIKRRKHSRFKKEINAAIRKFEDLYPDVLPKQEGGFNHFLAIPKSSLDEVPNNKIKFLRKLVKQDWSHIYSGGSDLKKFYVYAHCDPNTKYVTLPKELGGNIKTPFYIGKGTGNRAHELNRNQGHGIKIRDIVTANGSDGIVNILCKGLTEAQAYELEAKLIYFFGTIYQKDRRGILLNLETPETPIFSGYIVPEKKDKSKKIDSKRGQVSNG
jgi:hypothetical protein